MVNIYKNSHKYYLMMMVGYSMGKKEHWINTTNGCDPPLEKGRLKCITGKNSAVSCFYYWAGSSHYRVNFCSSA
jgi:hypothetical protein